MAARVAPAGEKDWKVTQRGFLSQMTRDLRADPISFSSSINSLDKYYFSVCSGPDAALGPKDTALPRTEGPRS